MHHALRVLLLPFPRRAARSAVQGHDDGGAVRHRHARDIRLRGRRARIHILPGRGAAACRQGVFPGGGEDFRRDRYEGIPSLCRGADQRHSRRRGVVRYLRPKRLAGRTVAGRRRGGERLPRIRRRQACFRQHARGGGADEEEGSRIQHPRRAHEALRRAHRLHICLFQAAGLQASAVHPRAETLRRRRWGYVSHRRHLRQISLPSVRPLQAGYDKGRVCVRQAARQFCRARQHAPRRAVRDEGRLFEAARDRGGRLGVSLRLLLRGRVSPRQHRERRRRRAVCLTRGGAFSRRGAEHPRQVQSLPLVRPLPRGVQAGEARPRQVRRIRQILLVRDIRPQANELRGRARPPDAEK